MKSLIMAATYGLTIGSEFALTVLCIGSIIANHPSKNPPLWALYAPIVPAIAIMVLTANGLDAAFDRHPGDPVGDLIAKLSKKDEVGKDEQG